MKGRRPVLTKDDVEQIRYLYARTAYNLTQLARLYRVSTGTIARAVEGKAKTKD